MDKLRMWRDVVGLGIILLFSVNIASVSAAEYNKKWSSGVNFGGARFTDGDLGTGLSARAFLEYAPYIPEIALKLSGGYLRFSDKVKVGYGTFSTTEKVSFEDMYLTGGIVYRLSRNKTVPFATANIGVYHYRMDEVLPGLGPVVDGTQRSPYAIVKFRDGYDLGVNVGGGVEFFITNQMSLSIETLVHFIRGKVDDEIIDCTAMFRFFPQQR